MFFLIPKNHFRLVIVFVLLSLTLAFPCLANQQKITEVVHGNLNLNHWHPQQQPAVNLKGQWRFIPDRLISPEQLNSAAASAATIEVPGNWNSNITPAGLLRQGHGAGTYWLTIDAPKNTTASLAIKRACSNATVFFSPSAHPTTTPITKLGNPASTAGRSLPNASSTLIPLTFQQSGIHHLVIQVSNFHAPGGGLCGEVFLGDHISLSQKLTSAIIEQSMLIAMLAMAAIYSLSLFIQDKKFQPPMWLMTTCFSAVVFFLSCSGLLEPFFKPDSPWLIPLKTRLSFSSLIWAATSIAMFYAKSFPDYVKQQWLDINIRVGLFITAFIALSPIPTLTTLSLFITLYCSLQFIAGLLVVTLALRDKKPYAKPMLLAVTPLIFTLLFISHQQTTLPEILMAGLYSLVFFIFVESQIIGRKMHKAIKLADRLSKHLQAEVDVQTSALNQQNKKLEKTQKALKSANEALRKRSITDGLTHIYNRMYFEIEFRKEWRRSMRQKSQISILMIDVDYFKQLNDSAGHLAGDQALQKIAKTLDQHFKRSGDLVARYGGEEFVVMLPQTDQRKALAAAEGLRHSIEQLVIEYNGNQLTTTVSIGISTTTPSRLQSADQLLEAADSALYKSKNGGRNRVSIIPLLPGLNPYIINSRRNM